MEAVLKVMAIFGVRPEAIKMAPVVKELARYPQAFRTLVIVTAQHREMLDQVLDHFEIKPDYDLNIMQPRQSLTDIATRALEGLEPVLREERPDLVLVHGDTSTTFIASLAAFYQQIPVGHVEAGLRTGQKYSPFPEEMNRRLTGALADLHFAPTPRARDNLLAEGVRDSTIFVTGNTAIDALYMTVREDYRFSEGFLNRLDYRGRKVIVADAHRRENFGEPMENICLALRDVVRNCPEVDLIFSVHRNPRVVDPVRRVLGEEDRVYLSDPLPYSEWANLMGRAYLIVTDSGGLQEEAPSLGTPVILLRDTTERPEAIEAGTVRMVGTKRQAVREAIEELIHDRRVYEAMSRASNPYGDGKAARRIAGALLYHFGLASHPPEPFGTKR